MKITMLPPGGPRGAQFTGTVVEAAHIIVRWDHPLPDGTREQIVPMAWFEENGHATAAQASPRGPPPAAKGAPGFGAKAKLPAGGRR